MDPGRGAAALSAAAWVRASRRTCVHRGARGPRPWRGCWRAAQPRVTQKPSRHCAAESLRGRKTVRQKTARQKDCAAKRLRDSGANPGRKFTSNSRVVISSLRSLILQLVSGAYERVPEGSGAGPPLREGRWQRQGGQAARYTPRTQPSVCVPEGRSALLAPSGPLPPLPSSPALCTMHHTVYTIHHAPCPMHLAPAPWAPRECARAARCRRRRSTSPVYLTGGRE